MHTPNDYRVSHFEVYEHIAFEHYIIEHKVYIVVARFWANKVR